MQLENKVAIVTGGARGIGLAIAKRYAAEGAKIIIADIDAMEGEVAAKALGRVDARFVRTDVGERRDAENLVAQACDGFGGLDILVNNAGILRTKPFTEFTTEDFNALVSVNLLGFLYITQLAVKQMLKQKSGNVVSITAALADQPVAGINASVSMMTKGGLNTVTRSLAIEYAKEGIRFNAVAPGVVDTPLHKDVPKEALTARQPMKTITDVKDIVEAVLYLSRASQVTGEILHVDGGSHAGRW